MSNWLSQCLLESGIEEYKCLLHAGDLKDTIKGLEPTAMLVKVCIKDLHRKGSRAVIKDRKLEPSEWKFCAGRLRDLCLKLESFQDGDRGWNFPRGRPHPKLIWGQMAEKQLLQENQKPTMFPSCSPFTPFWQPSSGLSTLRALLTQISWVFSFKLINH